MFARQSDSHILSIDSDLPSWCRSDDSDLARIRSIEAEQFDREYNLSKDEVKAPRFVFAKGEWSKVSVPSKPPVFELPYDILEFETAIYGVHYGRHNLDDIEVKFGSANARVCMDVAMDTLEEMQRVFNKLNAYKIILYIGDIIDHIEEMYAQQLDIETYMYG